MNSIARARLIAATLTGIWLLVVVLLWLLLPRLLEISGVLLTIWYAAFWIPAGLIALVPFVIASTFDGKGY